MNEKNLAKGTCLNYFEDSTTAGVRDAVRKANVLLSRLGLMEEFRSVKPVIRKEAVTVTAYHTRTKQTIIININLVEEKVDDEADGGVDV